MLRVGFVHRKDHYFFSGHHFDPVYYDFFYKALPHEVELIYLTHEDTLLDLRLYKDEFDVLILWDVHEWGVPDNMVGLQDLKVPVFCWGSDSHAAADISKVHGKTHRQLMIDYGVTHSFSPVPKEYFYQFYPQSIQYHQMFVGFNAELYKNCHKVLSRKLLPILNTGSLTHPFYKLRILVNVEPNVEYVPRSAGYTGIKYPELLSQYNAAIGACTVYGTIKYVEIPAAGCLPILEVTPSNHADCYGFEDGVSALFINESNYKDKLIEYAQTAGDKRWRDIASAARAHVILNYQNSVQATRFANVLNCAVDEYRSACATKANQ